MKREAQAKKLEMKSEIHTKNTFRLPERDHTDEDDFERRRERWRYRTDWQEADAHEKSMR